jgi:hypothetical protein
MIELKESDLTPSQLDDMLHALGKTQTPRRPQMGWRNYYYAGPSDLLNWSALVASGWAVQNTRNPEVFHVSDEGMKALGVTLKP